MRFIFCSLIIFSLFISPVTANAQKSTVLSENDITMIEKALETTAPDAHFSVLTGIAHIIINRYKSEIYPDSLTRIIEGDSVLKIDYSITPSKRTKTALYYAMYGSSPINEATGIKKLAYEEAPEFAEYIVIDDWCFFVE